MKGDNVQNYYFSPVPQPAFPPENHRGSGYLLPASAGRRAGDEGEPLFFLPRHPFCSVFRLFGRAVGVPRQ